MLWQTMGHHGTIAAVSTPYTHLCTCVCTDMQTCMCIHTSVYIHTDRLGIIAVVLANAMAHIF